MSTNDKTEKNKVTGKKKIAFTAIMLLIPVLGLALLESGLRLANYGGDLDLFVQQQRGSVSEYVFNPNTVKRYFFRKGIKTPIPYSQTFVAEKDSLTYRIFCLGASTTQGFPYPPNAAFPAMLENILSVLHPERKIEVVNCGITAVTSHSVLDMGREILAKYQPDLLVLYTGHNEFYGALGQASRLSLFDSRTLTRAFLKMQRSRLFLLVRTILVNRFGKRITRESVIDHATFMGTLAKEAGIRLDQPLFLRTAKQFRENLEEMIAEARRHGTDICISTLVANLADVEPFASAHPETFSGEDSTRWGELVRKAHNSQENDQYRQAADAYLQALKIDSSYAQTHFQLAKCYQMLQKNASAKSHFELARDYDTIRFRAPASFNRIVREIAKKHQVPLVDVERLFANISPGGITGRNLILEHVHPNLIGHLRIAKAITEKMSEHGMIEASWDWTNDRPDSIYLAMSHLTLLDDEVVNYTLFRLMSHWPFEAASGRKYKRVGTELTAHLAKTFIEDEHGSLVALHLNLGLEFYKKNVMEKALEEYLAALAIEPVCEAYNRLGLLYTRKTEIAYRSSKDYTAASENYNAGFSYFTEGLKRCPDHVKLNFNLGILYALRNDQTQLALSRFQKVLALEPGHKNALRQLGHIYVRRQEYADAERHFLNAIAYYPKEAEFYRSLGMVQARLNNAVEAEKRFNQALQLKPNDALTKHFLNQIHAKRRSGN